MVKNNEKQGGELNHLPVFVLSSTWKNVGMTMMCNRCDEIYDVMLKWHTRVTERKGMGVGGRERAEL